MPNTCERDLIAFFCVVFAFFSLVICAPCMPKKILIHLNCTVLSRSYFNSVIIRCRLCFFLCRHCFFVNLLWWFVRILPHTYARILPYAYFSGSYRMCAYVHILHYMRISWLVYRCIYFALGIVRGGGGAVRKRVLLLFCEPHPPPFSISWTKTTFPIGVILAVILGVWITYKIRRFVLR